MDVNALSSYVILFSLGCTAAHKVVEALRPLAAATVSKHDDEALLVVDKLLSGVESVLAIFSLRAGKK